jgi:phosphocarrier protein HPr
MPLIHREFIIPNKQGLHARPAAMFVKLASACRSEIWVEKDDEQINGKSIMGLMMLAAPRGAKLKITAEGEDAEVAMAKIATLIEGGFTEL